jgi:hypothetical protein
MMRCATEFFIDAMEHPIDAMRHRIDPMEHRLDEMSRQIAGMRHPIDATEHSLDGMTDSIDAMEPQRRTETSGLRSLPGSLACPSSDRTKAGWVALEMKIAMKLSGPGGA